MPVGSAVMVVNTVRFDIQAFEKGDRRLRIGASVDVRRSSKRKLGILVLHAVSGCSQMHKLAKVLSLTSETSGRPLS